jgi:hypothetical protein
MGFLVVYYCCWVKWMKGPGVQAEDVRRPLVRWIETPKINNPAHETNDRILRAVVGW